MFNRAKSRWRLRSELIVGSLLLVIVFLQACAIQTSGKAIFPPTDGSPFAVQRSTSGSQVTLDVFGDTTQLDSDEIVLIAILEDTQVDLSSVSLAPDFSGDVDGGTLLVWITAPFQTGLSLGSFSVDKETPEYISYQTVGSASSFSGKFGLEKAGNEGLITVKSGSGTGVCPTIVSPVCFQNKQYNNECEAKKVGATAADLSAPPCGGGTTTTGPDLSKVNFNGDGFFDSKDVGVILNVFFAFSNGQATAAQVVPKFDVDPFPAGNGVFNSKDVGVALSLFFAKGQTALS